MTNNNTDHDALLRRRLRLTMADLADPPHHKSDDGKCPDCGAGWEPRVPDRFNRDHRQLIHADDCQWVVMVDSLDAQQD